METGIKKYALITFWIIFITLTIGIYTYQILLRSGSDLFGFSLFISALVLFCLVLMIVSYFFSKYKEKYPDNPKID